MTDKIEPTYFFENFQLDTSRKLLLRLPENEAVALTRKAFEVLLLLVENSGKLVTKDDLMAKVWQGSFVEEANLTQTISVLRKTLGEKPNQHRFIVTETGKGYCFVAQVKELNGNEPANQKHFGEEAVAESTTSIIQQINYRSIYLIAFGSLLVLCLIIGAIVWWNYAANQAEPSPWNNATATQLTDFPGAEYFPSLAPDGKSLLYASRQRGNWDIYWRRIGGKNDVNLTKDSDANDTQPAFSPDGNRIAFRSERAPAGIYLMEATGENTRPISDVGFNPAWSPDGQELVASSDRFTEPQTRSLIPSPLWIINATTGVRRQLFAGDAVQPSWSPGGGRIAFWSMHVGSGQRDIWTINTNGAEPVQVTNDEALDWNPIWSPDGKFLYFASNRGGSMNFWRVPIDQTSGKLLGEAEPVTTPSSYSQHLSFSQNGKQMAYVQKFESVNLFQSDWDAEQEKIVGSEKAITQGGRFITSPDLSPDGAWFVYSSQGEKQEDLFLLAKDGTTRQLTNDGFNDRAPRWSPDSSRIAFYSDRSGRFEVWLINADGGGLQQVTYTSGQPVLYPLWSPDGNRVLFKQRDEMPFIIDVNKNWHEQTPQQLPKPAQATPTMNFWVNSWSPDGRKLLGSWTDRADSSRSIALYDFTTEQYIDLAKSPEIRESLGIMRFVDNRWLIFHKNNAIHLMDTETRKSKQIFKPETDAIKSYFVAPDKTALYYSLSKIEANIWLLTTE